MGKAARTIYFITGASGVGKTTLVETLKHNYKSQPWDFLHFDHIGVPALAEMIKEYGSGAAWQEAKTNEWINRAIYEFSGKRVFLEGQVNLQFIRDGFKKYGFEGYKIILLDCSEDEMERRLIFERKQPELANIHMKNWLKYLRKQAEDFHAITLDSTYGTADELLRAFEEAIGL